ncbi:hypothetical protein D3C81_1859250 [compost metagenome]
MRPVPAAAQGAPGGIIQLQITAACRVEGPDGVLVDLDNIAEQRLAVRVNFISVVILNEVE